MENLLNEHSIIYCGLGVLGSTSELSIVYVPTIQAINFTAYKSIAVTMPEFLKFTLETTTDDQAEDELSAPREQPTERLPGCRILLYSL